MDLHEMYEHLIKFNNAKKQKRKNLKDDKFLKELEEALKIEKKLKKS